MKCLAIDIGAESGRGVVGALEGGKLTISEVHRFPNVPIQIGQSLRWDLPLLLQGVKECVSRAGSDIVSVGIDTWAVDFVLLDSLGKPMEQPYHYRDSRTDGVMESAFKEVPREEIYETTGIQFLPFNTLFQLYSMVLSGSQVLEDAHRFLTIPDYLTFVLSGSNPTAAHCEFTNATTTQCVDARTGNWATDLLNRLRIPKRIFPAIVPPGTMVGNLTGGTPKVIIPACHDTASAVAAVPAEGVDHAWISSGTWSIMGIETRGPIINAETCEASFTNEGGIEGSYRFSKNVMGLWILQQCRSQWDLEGRGGSYHELSKAAEDSKPNFARFDPDDPLFLKPGDMPAKICAWLRDRGQDVPETQAQMTRVILESLAHKYKVVFDQLKRLSGRTLSRIHIIGGGSQNKLLNRLTAEACGVPIIPGPVEATAIGNLLVQMIAMGDLGSIAEGRGLDIES